MIRLHVDVIGLQRLPLAPAIRAEMVADVARAARQAVRDSFQSMLDRTQSQGFWGKARRSVNPPVIRDNKATIDITHTGVRLQWLGGTVRPTGRRSEVTGRPIRSLLIPFKDSPLRRRSLASLHLPEEEVMVLGDVDTGRAILARVRQRKRRNRDGHYQDVTPAGSPGQVRHHPGPSGGDALPRTDARPCRARRYAGAQPPPGPGRRQLHFQLLTCRSIYG